MVTSFQEGKQTPACEKQSAGRSQTPLKQLAMKEAKKFALRWSHSELRLGFPVCPFDRKNDLRRKIMWCCSETWLVGGVVTSFCIDIWISLVTSIKISLYTDTWIWFVDSILTFHSWSHRMVGTSFGWIYRISYTLTLGTVYGSNNLLKMETIFFKIWKSS